MTSKKPQLTVEETEILDSYNAGEFTSVLSDDERAAHIAAARQTYKKDKRVNIRLSRKDLELLQECALKEGLPYQTLMSSVLHKYVNGRFVDRNNLAGLGRAGVSE